MASRGCVPSPGHVGGVCLCLSASSPHIITVRKREGNKCEMRKDVAVEDRKDEKKSLLRHPKG